MQYCFRHCAFCNLDWGITIYYHSIKNRNLNTLALKITSSNLSILNPFFAEATVDVLANESGIVNGIFFQEEMMRKMFEKFPEVLLIDATYKQIQLRLPDIFP